MRIHSWRGIAKPLAILMTAYFGVHSSTRADEAASPKLSPAIKGAEFIYETAPFPSCHASTLAESKGVLVAAWFGGSDEGNDDVGIWLSRLEGEGWTPPVEVVHYADSSGKRFPCWNPVLFQPPEGPLLLFYKAGPRPDAWWGMLVRSSDGGKTWDEPRRLPDGALGPIKNKPVLLDDGALLCGSSTEHDGWKARIETTRDGGATWTIQDSLAGSDEFSAIQPTILRGSEGALVLLCRAKEGRIVTSRSVDGGRVWSRLTATELPNPNSGIDGVTLRDGRSLLVYNHATTIVGEWGGPRTPLNLAISPDATKWTPMLDLENEPGEYSYPAIIQTADGLVHVSYTWRRTKIKHVTLDPNELR